MTLFLNDKWFWRPFYVYKQKIMLIWGKNASNYRRERHFQDGGQFDLKYCYLTRKWVYLPNKCTEKHDFSVYNSVFWYAESIGIAFNHIG